MSDWNTEGKWRSDGLTVADTGDHWIILPGDDRLAVDACPCCGAWMRTRKTAKLVADRHYPLPEAA
jgi:hypothetical protein